jgi:hypothetical protein
MTRKDIEDRLVEEFDYGFIPPADEPRRAFFRNLNPVEALTESELELLEPEWEDFVTTLAERIHTRWEEKCEAAGEPILLTKAEKETLLHILTEADLGTVLGPEGYMHLNSIREKLS